MINVCKLSHLHMAIARSNSFWHVWERHWITLSHQNHKILVLHIMPNIWIIMIKIYSSESHIQIRIISQYSTFSSYIPLSLLFLSSRYNSLSLSLSLSLATYFSQIHTNWFSSIMMIARLTPQATSLYSTNHFSSWSPSLFVGVHQTTRPTKTILNFRYFISCKNFSNLFHQGWLPCCNL